MLPLRRKVSGPEHPDTLGAMNSLAWGQVMHADIAPPDAKRAVEFATQAVKLAPENASFVGTLGTAQYRAGNYADAKASLSKAMSLSKDNSQHTSYGFILALAHWQLGDKEQARKDYDQAVERMEKLEQEDPDLLRFKAEAAKLLGIGKPAKPEQNPVKETSIKSSKE